MNCCMGQKVVSQKWLRVSLKKNKTNHSHSEHHLVFRSCKTSLPVSMIWQHCNPSNYLKCSCVFNKNSLKSRNKVWMIHKGKNKQIIQRIQAPQVHDLINQVFIQESVTWTNESEKKGSINVKCFWLIHTETWGTSSYQNHYSWLLWYCLPESFCV